MEVSCAVDDPPPLSEGIKRLAGVEYNMARRYIGLTRKTSSCKISSLVSCSADLRERSPRTALGQVSPGTSGKKGRVMESYLTVIRRLQNGGTDKIGVGKAGWRESPFRLRL